MRSLLHRLSAAIRSTSPKRRPASRRRACLAVENLEERQVPAAIATAPITDMTVLAQQFPTHAGPTKLYLNFDGWTNYDGKGDNISAFQAGAGFTRMQEMHDILFRASEIFAPFNVEVERITGNGNYDSSNSGNTTVFIGAQSDSKNVNGGNRGWYSYTNNADYPRLGSTNGPNSDPFDLAFVDPVAGPAATPATWTTTEPPVQIAQNIVHEAGHTFGLAHVRTDKNNGTGPFLADPTPLPTPATGATPASVNQGTIPDIMSYTDANQYFANIPLPITTFNNQGNGTAVPDSSQQPWWSYQTTYFGSTTTLGNKIVTQNSYTYLQQVLGSRPTSDDFANVVPGQGAIDGTFRDRPLASMMPDDTRNGAIDRPGDFDVFRVTATSANPLGVTVRPQAAFDSVLLVYDSANKLVGFNDDAVGLGSRLTFTPKVGQQYYVVVGGYNANSAGAYTVNVAQTQTLVARRSISFVIGETLHFTLPVPPGPTLIPPTVFEPIPLPDPAPVIHLNTNLITTLRATSISTFQTLTALPVASQLATAPSSGTATRSPMAQELSALITDPLALDAVWSSGVALL